MNFEYNLLLCEHDVRYAFVRLDNKAFSIPNNIYILYTSIIAGA